MVWSVAGLVIALIGAYIGGDLPFEKAFDVLRGWGAGTDEEWKPIKQEFRRRSLISGFLLVLGTALQIYGTLGS